MSNTILDSQYASPNALLTSHGFPVNTSGNTVLLSHSPAGTYPDPGGGSPDTTPAAIDFGSRTNQTRSASNIESPNTVTVLEVTAATPITFNFTGSGQWQKNGGSWSSAASDTAVLNDTLKLRHNISASYGGVVTSTITFSPSGVTGTFTTTAEADPATFAISSTSYDSGAKELTINGALFGSKAGPAPYFFRSWASEAAGHTWAQAGYTQYRTDKWEGAARTVTGEGLGGASAVKITCRQADPDTDADGVFTHPQLFLPANCTQFFFSHWLRFNCLQGAPAGQPQIKGPRAGVFSGGGTDEAANYYANPKMAASLYSDMTWPDREHSNLVAEYPGWTDENGDSERSSYSENRTPVPAGFAHNTAFNWEGKYVFNDVGTANGAEEHRINGTLTNQRSDIQNRTSSGQHFDYFSPHPALENLSAGHSAGTRDWDVFFSRPYVDTGPDMLARVFLGNASTVGSCTGRFLCPPTTWGATQIKVTDVDYVPTDYDWVYVVKSDGTISNGYRWRGP